MRGIYRATISGAVLALALASGPARAADDDKPVAPAPAAIERPGLEVRGALERRDTAVDGKYQDRYPLEAQAGDLIVLDLTSTAFDPLVRIDGPNGFTAENDDARAGELNSRLLTRAPETGTYTVTVTSYAAGSRGRYRLAGRVSERPLNTALATRIEADLASGDERLDSGEYFDALTFTGNEGDLVEIDLSSAQFDPYLGLRGPTGVSYDNDDFAPGSTAARIALTLPDSGEYRMIVTSFAPGEIGTYNLAVVGAEATVEPSRAPHVIYAGDTPGPDVALGQEVQGSLEPGDPRTASGAAFDRYTLRAEPGSRVTVRLTADDFDTMLAAFGDDGSETSNDDFTGDGTNSRVDLVMPVSGAVTVVASSYGDNVKGRYTLIAQAAGAEVTGGGQPLTLGETVQGTLAGAEQGYLFEATAQQEVEFTLESAAFDPLLRITGPAEFSAQNDDDPTGRTLNSRLRVTLPEAGTYRLVATSFDGSGTGAYALASILPDTAEEAAARAAALIAAATPLVLGEPATGELTRDDDSREDGQPADSWAFTGTRGQRVTFSMESEAFDTWLAMELTPGQHVENDDRDPPDDTNSRFSVTLPEDGTYLLSASAFYGDATGAYTLTAETASEATRTVAATSTNARVYALAVGVADYERIGTLPFTDRDAEKLTETLNRMGVLAPESVTLTNAQATRANFAAALQTLAAAAGPDDLLLVFYSGHGDKVEGATTELDGSSETIELFDAALHDWELAEMFAGITARTLLVMDSCFSGGFDQVIDQRVERMGVFSSDADVLSLVAEKYQSGGYISMLLREALEGRADADGDRAITAGEVSEYMRRAFYRLALQVPLDAGGQDFTGQQALGYQHLIVDRGGDGMPYGQVLVHLPEEEDAAAE